MECPATAALVWAARIGSPLLLKTASPDARKSFGTGAVACLISSITAFWAARQRFAGRPISPPKPGASLLLPAHVAAPA